MGQQSAYDPLFHKLAHKPHLAYKLQYLWTEVRSEYSCNIS